MSVYNLKRLPNGYRMVKFDDYLNVESVYTILHRRGHLYCDCPQGMKSSTCRHRDMIPVFKAKRAIDTGEFYCYETQTWEPRVE